MRRAFPAGLEGRTALHCACNCGAHLFYAKEAGAGRCFGFDVRRHWIDQARFLATHRGIPAAEMRFEECDLYDLPALQPGRSTSRSSAGSSTTSRIRSPDSRLAADLTDELLVLRTATRAALPDGALAVERESPTHLMSGAYGLGWFPTGPEVLTRILEWLGFTEVRVTLWRHPPKGPEHLDLLELFAARTPGYFDSWDSGRATGDAGLVEAIETCVPPGATVFVMSSSDTLPEVHSRTVLPAPAAPDQLELDRKGRPTYIAIADGGSFRVQELGSVVRPSD